ncbi:MAG: translation initiation factor, partial [Flavobacteriales bacterium]|nr:translation initiation factor [Flavobacteriales bacterium]
SFEGLGGLVFSTNSDVDLSPVEDEIETLSPEAQRLKVKRDTSGRKGKVVTIIDGYQGEEEDIEELGRKVKKHCGVGGSVKDSQIIIQGDLTEKVRSYLISQGYTRTK